MATLLPRTLLALCLLLCACKQEKTPLTNWERAEKIKALRAEGSDLRKNGHNEQALIAFEKALELADKTIDFEEWTSCADSLAWVYAFPSTTPEEKEKGANLYREVLRQTESHFGKDKPETAIAIARLVTFFRVSSISNPDAEQLMRRALLITEATFGEKSPEVAGALGILFWTLDDLHKLAEAESVMRRALQIRIAINYKKEELEIKASIEYYRKLLLKMGDTEEQAQEKIDKMMEPLTKK